MVLPDFLIRLLEILHLKDSEEKKLKKRIAQCDENIRSLNQGLEGQVKAIKDMEAEFRELKAQYDTSSGPVRETLAVRMKNILKQRERMGEQRQMAEQQMNAEMLVRHNLTLQLEHRQHPDNHDLEEIRDEKLDIIDDLKEQAKTIEELEKTTMKKSSEKDEDFEKAFQAAEDEFKDVDLSFSAPKPEKKEEKEKDEA
ncbi:MAG: hypothetical protein J5743_08115 [Victivallales bacterium]|nr:hypothetical protein [Victivallales bacterium]